MKDGKSYWHCKCDCRNNYVGNANSMRKRLTKSCGCLNIDHAISLKLSHGERHTRLYHIWANMKNRCLNLSSRDYENYGGRASQSRKNGLNLSRLAAEAKSNSYSDDLSIDRINNDGAYSSDNCRWVSRKIKTQTGVILWQK